MLPKTRKQLRDIEDALFSIIKNHELLNYEKVQLNDALLNILNADYYLGHLHISHSELYKQENENKC